MIKQIERNILVWLNTTDYTSVIEQNGLYKSDWTERIILVWLNRTDYTRRTDRLEGVMLYSLTLFHGGDKNIIEYTDRDYMRSLYKNVPWRGKNFIIC
jgi:hypothetical protein